MRKAAELISRATQKHTKWFVRDEVERDEVIVGSETPETSSRSMILMQSSMATKQASTFEPAKIGTDKQQDRSEAEKRFLDKDTSAFHYVEVASAVRRESFISMNE